LNREGKRRALNRCGSGNLIDIVAIGEVAELKCDLLEIGQHLLVVGRLNQRHWQTPEGKKYTRTEIIATDLRRVEEIDELSFLKTDEGNR
jgi:single-stranded DNA-binding protein